MKIVGVIPARYASSRFPGKPLVRIAGIPMIIRVAEKVAKALGQSNTYIATDDLQIAKVATDAGFNAVMTSSKCLTGTDRVADFAEQVEADIYVNVQGDEPLIDPNDILKVIEKKVAFPGMVVNAMCSLLSFEDPANRSIPKVVTGSGDRLIYMSRLAVPGVKDDRTGNPIYKKQVCIYAFNREELRTFAAYKVKAEMERYEDIEILRFLDAGRAVIMVETSGQSIAVDHPEDVLHVEEFLNNQVNTAREGNGSI